MIKRALNNDTSFDGYTENERKEILEYLEKKKPKLDKFAEKLEDAGYKMHKSKFWRAMWEDLHGSTDDLDKFAKEYEKERNIS